MLILAVFGSAVAWLFVRPSSRKPRLFLFMVVLGYGVLSTPMGSGLLLIALEHGLTELRSAEEAHGVDTVVLLGGGAETFSLEDMVVGQLGPASALRALEAARVYKLLHARQVIASGGIPYPALQLRPEAEMLATALVQSGVPAQVIMLETGSRTTRDQARLIRPMILTHGQRPFVLVTSAAHMRRALKAFKAVGLDPIPAVSLSRSQHMPRLPWWLPNGSSQQASNQAIYEYAAWVYYSLTGWTKD